MIESVTVRQRGAYDFQTHYDNLCALQNSCPLPAVKAHLADGVLDINGDRVRSTDWVPIINSLRINKTLEFVAVRSYYQQTLEDADKRSNCIMKRKTPAVRSKEITYRLCKAMKECLSSTPALTCIEFQGLPLRDRDLSSLSKGIAKNKTLTHLSLEHCRVGDEGLDLVCRGVKNSTSITSLNFCGCGLSWKGADILAKVIKHQAIKRHNEAWRDSLRYRRPDLDRMSGIRRITVNNNQMMGDQGALSLAEALKDDLWLKALDLQQCGLSSVGAKALLDVLKYNTTIVVLDVRQNPMIDRELMQSIMEQVMINSNGQDTEYKWLKSEPVQQDSGKVTKPKKKRTKTLSSSFGKKTTIKVTSGGQRKRSKSVGAARPVQSYSGDQMKPGAGVPWRTAMRACRYRGYPPEHVPGKAHVFENSESSSPMSSPKHGTSLRIEYSNITSGDESAMEKGQGAHTSEWDDSEMEVKTFKQLKVELEQTRRRFVEEKEARAKSDQQLLELTVENTRLKTELEELRGRNNSLLDDDKVLESIEASFQQFHAFLDLLRDAGLGQLISMAGIDQSQMPFSNRPTPARPPAAQDPNVSRYGPAADMSTHSFRNYPSYNDVSLGMTSFDAEEILRQLGNRSGVIQPGIPLRDPNISRPAGGFGAAPEIHLAPPQTGQVGQPPSADTGVHTNVLPQNYRDTQDPTMQNIKFVDNRDGRPPEQKFDDLYQKVLKETEGVLARSQGEASTAMTLSDLGKSGSVPAATSRTSQPGSTERLPTSGGAATAVEPGLPSAKQHQVGSDGEAQNSGPDADPKSDNSAKLQTSQHSRHSAKSPDSKVSDKPQAAQRHKPPQPTPRDRSKTGGTISPAKSEDKAADISDANLNYSDSFEKTQSDISEEIEDVPEESDIPQSSPSPPPAIPESDEEF